MGLLIWLLSAGTFLLLAGAFVKADLNDMGVTFEWRRKARAKTREQADREPICLCEDLYTEHDLETGACRVKNCVCVTYLGPDPILSGLWSPSFGLGTLPAAQAQPRAQLQAADRRRELDTEEIVEMTLRRAAAAFDRASYRTYTTDEVVEILYSAANKGSLEKLSVSWGG